MKLLLNYSCLAIIPYLYPPNSVMDTNKTSRYSPFSKTHAIKNDKYYVKNKKEDRTKRAWMVTQTLVNFHYHYLHAP